MAKSQHIRQTRQEWLQIKNNDQGFEWPDSEDIQVTKTEVTNIYDTSTYDAWMEWHIVFIYKKMRNKLLAGQHQMVCMYLRSPADIWTPDFKK